MNEPTRMFDKYTKIWRELGFYERLEQIAAIFLSVLVSVIVVYACGHIVQVRIVVQIAILALVRKFILLDLAQTEAMMLIGLAALIVSLAVLHWVVKIADTPSRE